MRQIERVEQIVPGTFLIAPDVLSALVLAFGPKTYIGFAITLMIMNMNDGRVKTHSVHWSEPLSDIWKHVYVPTE